jgi:hypothetical protein
MQRSLLALALACAVTTAWAESPSENPDWKEVEVPAPPALRTQGLVELDVRGSSLHFGVDPQSVAIGQDSIVRFVVVATSPSGVVNAMYEGVRCDTDQVKIYARHNPDSGWVAVPEPQWQALRSGAGTVHSLVAARSGVCFGSSPNYPAAKIVRDLRRPPAERFYSY